MTSFSIVLLVTGFVIAGLDIVVERRRIISSKSIPKALLLGVAMVIVGLGILIFQFMTWLF